MSPSWKQRLAVAGSLLVLGIGTLWVYAPVLFGPSLLTAHHDNLDGAAPLRLEAARQWASGHLPLWNPYKRTGMPLLADTTAGAIYPGNAPFLFVDSADETAPASSEGSTPSALFRAMDQVAALHALLAGLFMFVFLRAIGLAAPASAFGGLVYGCCGVMTWVAAWYIQFQNAAAWLPLILAAIHRLATTSGGMAAWTAIGGGAVALQFFAGYPEASFYSGLLAIGYGLSLMIRSTGPAWWTPPVAVAAVYVVGLLLCSVQLLPSLELQSLARRAGSLPLEVFQSLPASAAMVWSWAWPATSNLFEFPPPAAYHFGLAAVLGALLGLSVRSRATVFFAIVLLVSFLLSVGDATPVNAWAHRLPGFSAFRHPFKHLFELSFAMAALAGLGADRLLRYRPGSVWPMGVVAAAALLTCVSLRGSLEDLVEFNRPAVDLSGQRPEIAERLEDGWRVLTPRRYLQARDPGFLLGDYPSQFRIPAVHGAGPFLWKALADAGGMVEEETHLRPGLFDGRDRLLSLLSCRYVVQAREGNDFVPALNPATWETVAEWGQARLVERRDALPRLRFAGSVRCSDAATMAATLRGGSVEPADLALVDCSTGNRPTQPFSDPADLEVKIVGEGPGTFHLATKVPDDGRAFLVVSQADYPGWQAMGDGRSLSLHRVHGLVQGVEIPGGTSRLDLFYRPPSLLVGAAISGATLLVLLLWNVAERSRARRRRVT